MVRVTVKDLQQNISSYLQRVARGETLLIVSEGKPVAECKPVDTKRNVPRPYGLCKGEFEVPDDLDDPLPSSIFNI